MLSQRRFSFLLALLAACSALVAAQDKPSIPVEEIVKRFAENEKEAKRAWEKYGYRLELRVQELDSKNAVGGEYRYMADIAPVQAGKRVERVVSAPPPTLKRIGLTSEDVKDFRETLPFVLTSDEIQKYDVKYVGTETVNARNCFVFDVKPKKTEKGQRYFYGKIWVEDQGLHIVKSVGKSGPDIRNDGAENLFPTLETNREMIGNYWFPVTAEGTGTLKFSNVSQRIRTSVKFTNYNESPVVP